jgi:predicted type IV restriction endonuclease
MSYEKSLETLNKLNSNFSKTALNEADTRFQIIDKIIKYTFFWPSENIRMENKTNVGYTDYQLTNSNHQKTYLVIEAKKQKVNFNFMQYSEITNHRIKVKILLKDESTRKTIEQVKNYCNDIGCKYACITNGHEWAFFRAYIDGKSWQDGNAYIFNSLQDIINSFTEVNKYGHL